VFCSNENHIHRESITTFQLMFLKQSRKDIECGKNKRIWLQKIQSFRLQEMYLQASLRASSGCRSLRSSLCCGGQQLRHLGRMIRVSAMSEG